MPEVMLLKIDHMANKPIPMTAKMDENITAISLKAVPKMNDSMSNAISRLW